MNTISPLVTKGLIFLLTTLSLEEKIGQLFMVPAITDSTINTAFLEHTPYRMDQAYVESLITQYHVGGVIFLGSSTATTLHTVVQHFQTLSTLPLLIGLDGEWGAAMRIRDTIKWPYAITLGAITDTALLQSFGHAIGTEYAALGLHINFAPVADINTNPHNPVIGYRSFGSCPDTVINACGAIAQGLRDAGIIACAKHFPGHGDTALDSHHALPVILHDRQRLDAVELLPFTTLIKTGIAGIMTAHVAVPSLDPDGRPASLSLNVVTDLLRTHMQFPGLIITDGLGMRAVTAGKKPGETELEALLAGNDILLCPVDVPQAVIRIKQALADGTLSMAQLDAHVLKILHTKAQITTMAAPADQLKSLLHTQTAYELKARLFEHAVTLVRDTNKVLPLRTPCAIVHVQLGTIDAQNHFAQQLDAVFNVMRVRAGNDKEYAALHTTLHTHICADTTALISVHGMSKYARDQYGMIPALLELIRTACALTPRSIVILLGNPYSTTLLPDAPCLLCGYEDEKEAHDAVTKILIGALPARGKLPI